jgi:hypothetical protein
MPSVSNPLNISKRDPDAAYKSESIALCLYTARKRVLASCMSVANVPPHLYFPYALVIAVKQSFGLSCVRHRSFFLMKIMRALDAGHITGRLDITAAGKRDGVGAQSIARISALCFAKAYGLTYVHTPFQTLAHAELPMPEWVATWEDLLGLGVGVPQAVDSKLPIVDIETYATNPALWKTDCLLATRHYHTFCKLAPQYIEKVARDLRAFFRKNGGDAIPYHGDPLTICLHIRRGDVCAGDAQTGHRFMANDRILPLVEQIRAVVHAAGRTCQIRLYSQGNRADFADFEHIPDLEMRLETPALDTFRELADADVLLMAQSDFSYTAAMYCGGIKICDPRHRVPLAEWVQIDPSSGRLDAPRLLQLLLAVNTGNLV